MIHDLMRQKIRGTICIFIFTHTHKYTQPNFPHNKECDYFHQKNTPIILAFREIIVENREGKKSRKGDDVI